MPPRDFYETLGVARSATADEIRSAHRKLAKKFHPDLNKDPDASKRFSEIQQAFDVLSDPQKRKQYDTLGHAGEGAAAGTAGGRRPGGAGTWSGGGFEQVNAGDFSEIFEGIFGGRGRGGGGGGSPFGRAGARDHATPGDDVEHVIDVDFMTAALGGTRALSMTGPDGATQTFDVRIPPGIATGGRLRVRGKGRAGHRGGTTGDLMLEVRVAEHPWFRRDGLDVLLEVPVTIAEAALGASVDVPLLRGSVTLKVPPGTSSGQRLRVRGKGVAGQAGAHGDFYAVIAIVAPRELEAEDAAALRKIAPRLANPREDAPWATVAEDA